MFLMIRCSGEFAKLRATRAIRASVVYVPTCQHANVPKACQLFNLACQLANVPKACHFFNLACQRF